MATIRAHVFIDRPADEVWKVVSDAATMDWFPGIDAVELNGTTRSVTFSGDVKVDEQIVTNDDELRRFQYRIVAGALPVDFHLGTVDVIEDGDRSLVIYSTEIEPDSLAGVLRKSLNNALTGLKEHLEG